MAESPDIAIAGLAAAGGPSSAGSAQTPEQLRALAAQFESLLLGQMLREMRQSMFDDEENKDNSLGNGPLADTLFAELSVALSRAGGLGLGNSLMGPLMSQAGVPAGADDTGVGMSLPAGLDLPDATAAAPLVTAAMPGRVTSAYGWRKDPIDGATKFHKGVDLAMPEGHDVPAARNGRVAFTGDVPGYGLTVVVKHDDRTSTRYAHLSEILVTPGQPVDAGQTIAHSGATGRVTGPHLHFEVLEEGQAVDPTGAW